MFRVNRQHLLGVLQATAPGLSPRDIVEQSSSYAFRSGWVMTFNDEVACRARSGFPKDFTAAVSAAPLVKALTRMDGDDVELGVAGGEFRVTAKRRRAGVRMAPEIVLPIGAVERPDEWGQLHQDFCEAVKVVQTCAGTDDSQFRFTCVHLTPDWIEACDNFQMTRWEMDTGFGRKCLVRRDSIKHVAPLGMTEFAETDGWVHFRNNQGLILSARKYLEDYPDLTAFLSARGARAALPGGLAEAAELAGVFSGENADNDQIMVELTDGSIRVHGEGASGWASETIATTYRGDPLAFLIAPTLLKDLVTDPDKPRECEIGADKLRVDGGHYVYLTVLGKPDAVRRQLRDRAAADETEPVTEAVA